MADAKYDLTFVAFGVSRGFFVEFRLGICCRVPTLFQGETMIAYTTLFSSKGEGAARCLCQDTRSHNKVYCRGYDQPQGRVSD